MNTALKYALLLLAAYLGVLLLLRIFEKRIIFLPNLFDRLDGNWQPARLPVEQVWLTTADGVKLHAWWIPAPSAEFTFIAFHGNAGNITHRAEVYEFLRTLPADVLAVEYRGYGRSEGSPDEQGVYLDAQAAYDYLAGERRIPGRRIISFGQSLGTAVAAELAVRRDVGGIVLEAPFASSRAIARRIYWFLPGLGYLVGTKFETAAKLARSDVPKLLVHCANDPVLPFALGEEVFAAAKQPKTLYRVDAACHEEASLVAPGEYRAQLRAFLATVR